MADQASETGALRKRMWSLSKQGRTLTWAAWALQNTLNLKGIQAAHGFLFQLNNLDGVRLAEAKAEGWPALSGILSVLYCEAHCSQSNGEVCSICWISWTIVCCIYNYHGVSKNVVPYFIIFDTTRYHSCHRHLVGHSGDVWIAIMQTAPEVLASWHGVWFLQK